MLFDDILKEVEKETGFGRSLLLLSTRGRPDVARARQIAMYCCVVLLTRETFGEIGRLFHRDRTTVAHAFRIVRKEVKEDSRTRARVKRILDNLSRIQ